MDSFTFTITDKEILELISNYKDELREPAVIKALKIGLIALKDIETIGNVDYVEKEFQKFKTDLDKDLIVLKEDFANKLKETDDLVSDKLSKNFDPDTGIMPVVLDRYLGDGGKLSDLFDENNNTSAVGKIKAILAEYFDTDASRVYKLLDPNNPESPLSTFKKDMSDRLIAIEKEIRAKGSAEEAARLESEKGTQKGFEYEDVVFAEIEKIASILGDTCLPTGKETGLVLDSKQGDFVVTINPSQTGGATLKIVFEAKDREMYLGSLLEEIENAKKNRGAGVGVAVVSGKEMLKDVKEAVGIFRDYPNQRTICILDKETHDPIALEVAYKLARAKLLLGLQAKAMKSEFIDVAEIGVLIDEIVKKLTEFSAIKATLTKASGAIVNAQTQIDDMKADLTTRLEELAEKAKPIVKK